MQMPETPGDRIDILKSLVLGDYGMAMDIPKPQLPVGSSLPCSCDCKLRILSNLEIKIKKLNSSHVNTVPSPDIGTSHKGSCDDKPDDVRRCAVRPPTHARYVAPPALSPLADRQSIPPTPRLLYL
jgi:hypothetical protein